MDDRAWVYLHDERGGLLIHLGTLRSWAAVSGPHGKGALPPGKYLMSQVIDLDFMGANAKPYRDRQGDAWFLKLNPQFKTERTGLAIHPDGNVPGTLGCIGLKQADTSDAKGLLDRYFGTLHVVYRQDNALPLEGVNDSPA